MKNFIIIFFAEKCLAVRTGTGSTGKQVDRHKTQSITTESTHSNCYSLMMNLLLYITNKYIFNCVKMMMICVYILIFKSFENAARMTIEKLKKNIKNIC